MDGGRVLRSLGFKVGGKVGRWMDGVREGGFYVAWDSFSS